MNFAVRCACTGLVSSVRNQLQVCTCPSAAMELKQFFSVDILLFLLTPQAHREVPWQGAEKAPKISKNH
jgi:hypothetical protein